MENFIGNTSQKIELREVLAPANESIKKLRKDVEITINCRSSLCDFFGIKEIAISSNSPVQNFTLGLIDGLMEFPIFVEMYVNNPIFRDLLWQEFKKISVVDMFASMGEVGKSLVVGNAYEKGKASIRTLLLFTGLAGLLRQFGISVLGNAAKMSMKKVGIGAGVTVIHGAGYATEYRGKDTLNKKIEKNLPF